MMTTVLTPEMILKNIPALAASFCVAVKTRHARARPRLLIVEDQLFSRKLLHEMLRHNYDVDVAETAKEAMNLYLQYAPDIAFLDIELMDESGHTLANFIRTVDPDAYIVMVTGNNSVEDVTLAKSNRVAGFIVKPYNKAKIYEAIAKYTEKNRAAR